jgi:hypothetical protein
VNNKKDYSNDLLTGKHRKKAVSQQSAKNKYFGVFLLAA